MTGGVLMRQVMGDEAGLRERIERERSRMTHQVFLLAESGLLPTESERRTQARAATARAWMVHVAASLEPVWADAPPGLGTAIETWFAANGERLEVIELDLARRVADGPVDDLATRERRVDLGSASRWLFEAIGAVCDPDGDGGPAYARRGARWLDAHEDEIATLAGDARLSAPDDERLAESAELLAHVQVTVAALEALTPGLSEGPSPSA